jgi:predicted alpha/beta hydrolase family esterase
MTENFKTFTIPGLYGSGIQHWQTRWEDLYGYTRINQNNWDDPVYEQWHENLMQALRTCKSESVVLIAHSLGCHLVAKSYHRIKQWTRGIFFVAPPDLKSEALNKDLSSFKSELNVGFECMAWLIYSEDDPFASVPYSKSLGDTLRMKNITMGKKGHINSDSNIGDWDEGCLLFNRMTNDISCNQHYNETNHEFTV